MELTEMPTLLELTAKDDREYSLEALRDSWAFIKESFDIVDSENEDSGAV